VSIFKRGGVYWFNFVFNDKHIQHSTKQDNPNVARQMEAAIEPHWRRAKSAFLSEKNTGVQRGNGKLPQVVRG